MDHGACTYYMNLIEAQLAADTAFSEARRLYVTLRNNELITTHELVTKKGDTKALEQFEELVTAGRYKGLQDWVKKHRERSLADLAVRELRIKAASYGIPMYYRKTKAELIQLIRYAEERPKMCAYCNERHAGKKCSPEYYESLGRE